MMTPRSAAETERITDGGVTIPRSDLIPVPAGIGIIGQFSPIRPNLAPLPGSFKKLQDSVRQLNKFDWRHISEEAREAQGIALSHWIISQRRRYGFGTVRGFQRIELRFAPGSPWRNLIAQGLLDAALQLPNSREVMRVMWWRRSGSSASTSALAR